MGDRGTTSEDYGEAYFQSYAGGDYHGDAANWIEFFGGVADKLVGLFEPQRVLDAGCAKGLLVAALAERGVDATGIDISDHAIAEAPEAIKDRLAVGSLIEPISDRFDLITCIEVLEHMSPHDADAALDNLTDAADLVVFSSTPRHFEDPTHVNVRQPADWAGCFAERGFFRRFDLDLRFLSPWAVAFERRAMTPRDAVFSYETLQWPLRDEVATKRDALLEKERLASIAGVKADQFDELAAEAERRQVVIDELAAEAERRQVVIDELAAEAEHRQVVIDELAAEAERRQVLAGGLMAEAEHAIADLENEVSRSREALSEVPQWVRRLSNRARRLR